MYGCWLQAKMRERLLREKSQQLAAQRQQQQPPQHPQQMPQQPHVSAVNQQQQAQPQQQGVAVPPYQPGVDPQPAAPPQQAPQQVQHGQLPPAAAVVPAVPGFKSVSGIIFDHRALCAGRVNHLQLTAPAVA